VASLNQEARETRKKKSLYNLDCLKLRFVVFVQFSALLQYDSEAYFKQIIYIFIFNFPLVFVIKEH
jgi:hypothetical protein